MFLLGQQLQQAGLAFISAKASHGKNGLRIDSIVCATAEDAAAVNSWAADRELRVHARVATTEEMKEHRRWQELA